MSRSPERWAPIPSCNSDLLCKHPAIHHHRTSTSDIVSYSTSIISTSFLPSITVCPFSSIGEQWISPKVPTRATSDERHEAKRETSAPHHVDQPFLYANVSARLVRSICRISPGRPRPGIARSSCRTFFPINTSAKSHAWTRTTSSTSTLRPGVPRIQPACPTRRTSESVEHTYSNPKPEAPHGRQGTSLEMRAFRVSRRLFATPATPFALEEATPVQAPFASRAWQLDAFGKRRYERLYGRLLPGRVRDLTRYQAANFRLAVHHFDPRLCSVAGVINNPVDIKLDDAVVVSRDAAPEDAARSVAQDILQPVSPE